MVRATTPHLCFQAQQGGRESPAPFPSHALPEDETPSTVRAIEQQLEQLMQELDVAVAERDLDTARSVLQVGTDALAVLDRDADVLALEVRSCILCRPQHIVRSLGMSAAQ